MVVIAMPLPISALPKVKTGIPPKLITSVPATPLNEAVPDAVATMVPSYSLLSPVRPVTVTAFEVISADSMGCVKV